LISKNKISENFIGSYKGKRIIDLPLDIVYRSILAINEVRTPVDLMDSLENLKYSIQKQADTRSSIIFVLVKS
jgi:hypothetical protein